MTKTYLKTAALAVTLFLPAAAMAQGTIPGAESGAREGAAVGGPIGAIVGGAVGAATGTVGGILGVDTRPRFREYAVRERRPSYTYREEVRVGSVLPEEGVTYYDAPLEYGLREHRYTVVNGRHVIVEPRSRRIVEIVD